MSQGFPGLPLPTPVGVPGGHGGPGPDLGLWFQFWSDTGYEPYAPEDNKALVTSFNSTPRPQEVRLPGGKYIVKNFAKVQEGRSSQLNAKALGRERHVRLKPPYKLPGYDPPKLPDRFHFEFEDDRSWRPYDPYRQRELEEAARCVPPPGELHFTEGHNSYVLWGLDSLGQPCQELMQVNVRTQKMRRVVLKETPATGIPQQPPPMPSMGSVQSQAHRPHHSHPGGHSFLSRLVSGGASSSSAGRHAAANGCQFTNQSNGMGDFSLSNLSFSLGSSTRSSGGGRAAEPVRTLSPHDQEALRVAWATEPRPEKVSLSGGNVVEGFQDVEVGGASLRCPAAASSQNGGGLFGIRRAADQRIPLEVHLPLPGAGCVMLPDGLDIETAKDALPFGRFLSNREVACLPARGAEANVCSVCLMPMEPSGDASDPDVMMAPVDNQTNQGLKGGEVFELNCGHCYHAECINQWFASKRRCPQCQKDFGKVVGNQPRRGSFQWHLERFSLPGHKDAADTIVIQFEFPRGINEEGQEYDGRKPKGYLPGNAQGIILLELFKVAFRRCVMFGIGNSMSYGTFRPTFNIHIKTSTSRGATGHGYPDDSYYKRALEELRTNGVTMADLPK